MDATQINLFKRLLKVSAEKAGLTEGRLRKDSHLSSVWHEQHEQHASAGSYVRGALFPAGTHLLVTPCEPRYHSSIRTLLHAVR